MKSVYAFLVPIITLCLSTNSSGYDVETHQSISEKAVGVSALNDTATLQKLGLRPVSVRDDSQVFPRTRDLIPVSVLDLITFGSAWEDNLSVFQALRHFYDPVYDRALTLPIVGQSLSQKSPDWALEDAGQISDQDFSYADDRDYFYKALTSYDVALRKQYWGRTFQTLGHVIHHLQDMAQPQHARNDPHCPETFCRAIALLTGDQRFYAPSLYENYTNSIRESLPYSGDYSAPVYPGADAGSNPFKYPRKLWIGDGKGISEYTNRGFFSADTLNNVTCASPVLPSANSQPTEMKDIQELLPGSPFHGQLSFWALPVYDALNNVTQINKRAVTNSIFDADLQYSTSLGPIFALNHFNFDSMHQLLIPRAVSYSAGLINYFFRGQMAISLPDEGVYGIVDHTTVAGSDPKTGGFDKIKLKLQNITPGGTDGNGNAVVEKMDDSAGSAATLVAVAKFHVNNCYKADLSGEYGALNPDGSLTNDWKQCRSNDEQIVVSQPVAADKFAGINDGSKQILFDFSANKIPISATNLYLQVVYRGKLGQEADAVVVATQDISEPTYFYAAPHWDQYMYCRNGIIGFSSGSGQATCDQYTFKESFCDQLYSNLTYEQCKAREGWTIKAHAAPLAGYNPDPAVPAGEWQLIGQEVGFAPLYTLAAPIGTLARVAVLTDAAPQNQMVSVQEWGVSPNLGNVFVWGMGTPKATIVQLDAQTGKLDPSVRYAKARGVYVETVSYPYLSNHTAPLNQIPDLVMVSSQINF